jgi:hypothetical protein
VTRGLAALCVAVAAITGCGARGGLEPYALGAGGAGASSSTTSSSAGGGGQNELRCRETADVHFTSTGEVDVMRAVPGPECTTFAVGAHFGATDFGGVSQATNDWDGFIARLAPTGEAEWVLSIATVGNGAWADNLSDVVTDELGNSWVTGNAGEPLTLAGQTVLGAFVLALDPGGAVRWLAQLEASSSHLARHPNGTLSILLESPQLTELVLDDATGAWLAETPWASTGVHFLAGAHTETRRVLALCIEGDVLIRGKALSATDDTPDGNGAPTCDLALVAFEEDDGVMTFAETFQEHGFRAQTVRVALRPDGGIALSAGFWGRIDLGLGELAAAPIGAGMRGFVALFDAAGKVTANRAFGDAYFVYPTGLAPGLGGAWTTSGVVYHGSLDLGGGPIGPVEGYLGFDGSFDESGNPLASAARPGLLGLFAAEPGLGLSLVHSPDGEEPRRLVLAREVLPAGGAGP